MATLSEPRTISEVPLSAHTVKFCDTLEIDQGAHRLYAGDNWSGGVDIFDVSGASAVYQKTARRRGTFNGIAIAPELKKVFVAFSNGLLVIDADPASPTVDTIVATIAVGGKGHPDLIDYDPVNRKVYAPNRNDGLVTVIDAVTNKPLKEIGGLGGGLEQVRANSGDGMVYVSGNADNVLWQIDGKTDELVRSLDIGEQCHPNGLAINPKTQKAVLANSGQGTKCVVFDLAAGKLQEVIEGTGRADGAVYDPIADRFFIGAASFRDGPVIGVFDGQGKFLGNIPSGRLASWVAYDQTGKRLFAPTVNEGRPAVLSVSAELPA